MKSVKLSLNNFFWLALCLVACLVPAASAQTQPSDDPYQLPLFPKYMIMGVVYAPPGASSYVKYGNSKFVGSSNSISSMQLSETVKTTSTTGGGFLGIFGHSSTTTNTDTWITQKEQTSSLAVLSTSGNSISTMGPISSALGVNHDNDVIYIWLDPVSIYTVKSPGATGSPLNWTGLQSNSCDLNAEQVTPYQGKVGCDPNQYPEADIIGIPVWCLKNPYSPYQGCAQWLQYTSRSWDKAEWDVDPVTNQPLGPGLTLKDYADILRADPFVQLNGQAPNPCHPTYGVKLDPNVSETTMPPVPLTSTQATLWVNAPEMPTTCGGSPYGRWNRFLPVGEVQFPVPGPNGLPTTFQGIFQYQTNSGQTYTAADTHTVSYSKQTTNDYGAAFSHAVAAAAAFIPIPGVGSAIGSLFNFSGSTSSTHGNTSTWQNQSTNSITSGASNEADYVITGPQLSDNYTGPATFNVYQDNVYGTFAFYSPLEPPVTLGTICINNCTQPASFNWPSIVQVNQRGALKSVTLTNHSIYSMTMAGPAVTFSDPGFMIDPKTDHCSNVLLLPEASCPLNIIFAPVVSDAPKPGTVPIYASMIAAGTENASMSVSSATSPTTQDVLVVAETLASGIAAPDPSNMQYATLQNAQNQDPYAFPSQTNDAPQTITYTLTSYYTAGVTLVNGTQSSPITLSNQNDFSIVANSCIAGLTLSPTTIPTCQFTVQYLAQVENPLFPFSTTVTVLGSVLGNVSQVTQQLGSTLHLTGLDPGGQIDPQGFGVSSIEGSSCYYCGIQTVGNSLVPVVNHTLEPLTNISVGGPFNVESDNCPIPPATLAVGAECDIVLSYSIPENITSSSDTTYPISVSGMSTYDGVHGTQYENDLTIEVKVDDTDPYPGMPGYSFTTSIPGANTSQVVTSGGVAQYSFQIAPTGKAYASPITFSVDGLPNGATAGFNPATIAANAGPQAVTLSIQTTKTTAMLRRPEWMATGTLLCMLLLLPLPTLKRNRRLARLLMLVVTIFAGAAATVSLSGCAGSGTTAGVSKYASNTYNVVVTVHSGTTKQTMPLQLTIQ